MMTDMNQLMIARTKLDDAQQLLNLAYGMCAAANNRRYEAESKAIAPADDPLFIEITKTEAQLAELIRAYADELDIQIRESR